jgi:hypothetical protein
LAEPQAHPEGDHDLGRQGIHVRVLATGEERTRLWSAMQRLEPNLDAYATRRSGETAVVVFEPR